MRKRMPHGSFMFVVGLRGGSAVNTTILVVGIQRRENVKIRTQRSRIKHAFATNGRMEKC